MKRPIIIAIAAAAGVLSVVLVALLLRARAAKPGPHIDVRIERPATALVNETDLAMAIERAVSTAPGLREVRSESTSSGVRVSCLFDAPRGHEAELDAFARVRKLVAGAASMLPADAYPPVIVIVPSTQTWFVRSQEPLSDRLRTIPGVASVESCGAAGPERTLVRVDLARLEALGLDLVALDRALSQRESPHGLGAPSTAGGAPDALGALTLRGGPAPIVLRDVATIAVDRRPPSCRVVSTDDPTFVHVVQVHREHGRSAVDALRALGEAPLAESDALRIALRFAPGISREAQAIAMRALVMRAREVKGLTLHAALLRDDATGELVFDTTTRATRESIDELRALVPRQPGLAWGGARGAAGDVRRLRVRLRGQDLAELDAGADEVKRRVQAVPGVVALVRDPTARVPQRRVDIDRGKAAGLGLSPQKVAWALLVVLADEGASAAPGLDLTVERPGLDALATTRVAGQPLSSLRASRTRSSQRRSRTSMGCAPSTSNGRQEATGGSFVA